MRGRELPLVLLALVLCQAPRGPAAPVPAAGDTVLAKMYPRGNHWAVAHRASAQLSKTPSPTRKELTFPPHLPGTSFDPARFSPCTTLGSRVPERDSEPWSSTAAALILTGVSPGCATAPGKATGHLMGKKSTGETPHVYEGGSLRQQLQEYLLWQEAARNLLSLIEAKGTRSHQSPPRESPGDSPVYLGFQD
ncbi:Gastrin-releasing peptide [Pteropus alecto]|uniref:Gastrin-releasing peptide n=1 Tax=Pteropus alecto TaxID=9402 RepID=L5KHB8_PTEAL|nr:Gastrin-releasing peptide [Pteropus alecto]